MSLTAAIITLGCRLNQADSALLAGRLARMGISVIPYTPEGADVLLVNSCAVTATASRKSRQTIRSFRTRHPEAVLVLTVCAATVEPDSLGEADGIDLIFDNETKKQFEAKLSALLFERGIYGKKIPMHAPLQAEKDVFFEDVYAEYPCKSRANLKIQEGCSNFCSYCIVPYARGPERSRDFQETVEDFRRLLDAGFHEIALTGINICTYSCGGKKLPDLLEKLLDFPGGFRLRLGSLEPGETLERILPVMAGSNGRICAFLHPSLQHGSDAVLRRMNRHYLTGLYSDFVQKARKAVPDIHIGTDLIVGFPGETDALFEESCAFIEKINFSNIHIFPFSPRAGTPAAGMKQNTPGSVIQEREKRLQQIRNVSMNKFRDSLIGTVQSFIPETSSEQGAEGWTGNYVRVRIPAQESVRPGELMRIRILAREGELLIGQAVPDR